MKVNLFRSIRPDLPKKLPSFEGSFLQLTTTVLPYILYDRPVVEKRKFENIYLLV